MVTGGYMLSNLELALIVILVLLLLSLLAFGLSKCCAKPDKILSGDELQKSYDRLKADYDRLVLEQKKIKGKHTGIDLNLTEMVELSDKLQSELLLLKTDYSRLQQQYIDLQKNNEDIKDHLKSKCEELISSCKQIFAETRESITILFKLRVKQCEDKLVKPKLMGRNDLLSMLRSELYNAQDGVLGIVTGKRDVLLKEIENVSPILTCTTVSDLSEQCQDNGKVA